MFDPFFFPLIVFLNGVIYVVTDITHVTVVGNGPTTRMPAERLVKALRLVRGLWHLYGEAHVEAKPRFKIGFIKQLRSLSGIGLKDAKDAIELALHLNCFNEVQVSALVESNLPAERPAA